MEFLVFVQQLVRCFDRRFARNDCARSLFFYFLLSEIHFFLLTGDFKTESDLLYNDFFSRRPPPAAAAYLQKIRRSARLSPRPKAEG